MPPPQNFKLNVDGASKGNPGLAGGGGLIRDHHGSLVLAYSHFYGPCHSLVAEARAMLDGLRYAAACDIKLHSVESDSLVLVNIIKTSSISPWRLIPLISELRSLITFLEADIVHTYREGNHAADGLANHACKNRTSSFFLGNSDLLPPLVRGSCRLDKLGIPNIRF